MVIALVGVLTSSAVKLNNLRIEAWDAEGICVDLIDVAVTDARGQFEMQLDADYLAELLPQKVPEVAFRIFDNGKPITQAQQIVWRVNAQSTRLQIPLAVTDDPKIAKQTTAQSVVRGSVKHANGLAANGLLVRAFDRNLGAPGFTDTQLGQVATGSDGHYEIRYSMPAGGKLKPDLIVRVFAAPTTAVAAPPTTAPLAESTLISHAPTVAVVHVGLEGSVAPLRSEHRGFVENLAPVLQRSNLTLADLKPEHVEYAAGAAGLQPDRVSMMANAERLAHDAGGTIPSEVWYGLLRTGFRGDLDALLDAPISVLREQLDYAIDQNFISSADAPQLDAIVTALHNVAVARALPAQRGTVISAALANSLAPPEIHQAFVRRWIGRSGSAEDLWEEVRADPQLAPHADELETATRLQILFGGFQPTLAELRTRRQSGSVKSLRDLARWQDADWHGLLQQTGVPPGVPGDTSEARVASYASGLQSVVRGAFPTEYLRGRAATAVQPLSLKFLPALAAANPTLDLTHPLPDEPNWGTIAAADQAEARSEWDSFQREARTFRTVPARTLLESVIAGNGVNPLRQASNRVLVASTVDLENTTVEQHLADHPNMLDGVPPEHRLGVVNHLKGTQRVLRAVGQPEAVEPLLADGLDSAVRIVRVPRRVFVERYTDVFGDATAAHHAYNAAFRTATTTQFALTTVSQSMADTSPWAVRGGSTAKFQVPDHAGVLQLLKKHAKADDASWPVLFGSDAWCDCDECQSALGPAAYFVDLIHMIDPDDHEHTPADLLFKRRADLEYLPLTCDNTNTPIPYIDLVNEILETYIASRLDNVVRPPSYDNAGLSADELRAVPQNVIPEVYSRLAIDVYPFTLPFQRSLAVMRSYLDQLGTSYRDVYKLFGSRDPGDQLTHAEHLAAEDIGLSRRQFKLIAGLPTEPSYTLPELYGFGAQDSQWRTTLSSVPELLSRMGITYDDLYALVHTFFLNPSHADGVRLQLEHPKECQIDDTHLLNATSTTWERLHRFVRLRQATAWSIADLDRILFAIGAHDPDDHSVILDRETLRRVGLVKRIAATLDQPLIAVLALWSDMDSWGSDSLYLGLFENRTVARIDGNDPAEFDLELASYDAANPDRKSPNGFGQLKHSDDKLSDHLPRVLAALRISSADLELIWAHAASLGAIPARNPVHPGNDAKLTLHHLTVVYRYTVLAKGLGRRVADLVTLLTLTGADPFANPVSTLDFINLAGVVSASGFSLATLDYIYRHRTAPGQGPAPADSVVSEALTKVWTALRAVRQDTALTDDPDGTLLATRLALIQQPEIVASILDALDPAKGLDVVTRGQILRDGLGATLGGGEQVVLPTQADPDPDPQAATYAIDAEQRKRDNQATLLALISGWLRTSLSQSSVVSMIAATLGLTDSMTRRLLVDWIPGDTGSALDTFLDLAGGGLTGHHFANSGFTGAETIRPLELVAAPATADGNFRSVRWIGRVLPLGDGEHTFVVRTNGAVTLTVGTAVKTIAAAPSVGDTEVAVTLTSNQLAPITVEYDAGTGAHQLELLWRLGSAPSSQSVPVESLFPEGGLTALDDDGRGPGYLWRRTHKAALLIAGFGLNEAEVDYAESPDHPFGEFQLRNLPMSTPAAATLHTHLAQWHQFATFVAVRSSLPNSDTTLVNVLTKSDPNARLADWSQRLCSATGWDIEAVTSLLDASTIAEADWATLSVSTIIARLLDIVAGPVEPGGSLDLGNRLSALQRSVDLINRVGVSAATLRAWTDSEPQAADADEVIQAVRACYPDDAQWFQVAQTRNDSLRQLQRDALVAQIMARIQIDGAAPKDINSLFEHFLIDVEMCACGITSRVKQAISSVQLFIQRIMLGLEQQISPSKIDPDRWEWNAEYRVWQANREIFLYPENWIDPELRVDQTPFFADLQSQLSQGPLDADNVESAFRSYLDKLEDVSRLKVCAIHWQREGNEDADSALAADTSIDTLHVVARSQGAHPIYYYRTLLGAGGGNGGTEWTPWQKIDVDILGDGDSGDVHMLLATFNRRLYLFWAQFTEAPERTQPGANQGDSPPPPLTHWDIRLAWSTYRDGAWSPKQVTSDSITSKRFITGDKSDLKSFKSAVKEFEAASNQADASYKTMAANVQATETALMGQLGALHSSFRQIWQEVARDYGLSSTDAVTVVNYYAFFSGAVDLPTLEKMCSNTGQTFEQFISDLFDLVASWPEGFLSPAQGDLLDAYDSIKARRRKRDDLKDRYEKVHRAVKNFNAGKSHLAVPAYTRRGDHTLWLSTRNETVDIYVLRHDESAKPIELGNFSLSEDGRSISAAAAAGRIDLSHQMPRHSSPNMNGFTIETHQNKGLDLQSLPNLLGKVHHASFYHEHWFRHPISADNLRPFFIAKGSELHAALPNIREIHSQGWHTAAPRGGFGKNANGSTGSPANQIDARPTNAPAAAMPMVSSLRHSVGDQIAAPTAFGLASIAANQPPNNERKKFCFEPFHHPFIKSLIKRLERDGLDGLLATAAQNPAGDDHGEKDGHFDDKFNPAPQFVTLPYAPYDVDFRPQGSYSQYNWELFFHAPYLIATRLMQDARYDDARRWLHYIFDPTSASKEDVPERFWKLQWFRDHSGSMDAEQMMTALATDSPPKVVAQIQAQIEQWYRYPADPHRIACLRTSAYQKAIVFKYLDNLIAWADSLFTQNTIETINQATQLYIFASHLLGPRPQHVPQKDETTPFCYHDLRGGLDEMSDMLALVESTLHPHAAKQRIVAKPVAHVLLGISHLPVTFQVQPAQADGDAHPLPSRTLAFCVPANTKLFDYFNTIDDRLFKIRNCMNIEGVVEQLPLFEPPIDPALLVRAAAMGLDIGSILADLSAPLPFHRFSIMLQKALELCSEVKSLGAQLLAALEKRDGETLALLRSTHDTALLKAVMDVKKQQVDEAETNKTALQKSRDVTQAKHDYYASRPFTNSFEDAQLVEMAIAMEMQMLGSELLMAGSAGAFAAPDADIGPTGMGAHATAKYGGSNAGNVAKAIGEGLGILATALHATATMSGIQGTYARRQDEWTFQTDLANKELAQIDKQLAAADIKIAIANLELNNQQLQIDNAKKVEDTLRTKYTNTELYQWMVTQISTTYYQAYKLAYDLAKRAERCYRHELGITSSGFVQFGYWDSLRKGLLAGEQLALDLKRMDASYLQTDRRNFEITRQLSLVLHDPQAFISLRTQGSCEVDLPEELFDADYPGHYFRRIKSVSLTLPCVAGPYTPINCTLTLLQSHVRIKANATSPYPEQNPPNDPRFSHSYGAIQSVATSHGQNDAGMFEVNFRDERYLPFEGAGAISRWRIDLPKDCNAFDFDSLSDVVIKLSYTARDGGKPLADSARKSLHARWATTDQAEDAAAMTPLRRLFRLRYEFSDAWTQFRNTLATGNAKLVLTIDRDRFPYLFRVAKLTIVGVRVFAVLTDVIAQQSLTLVVTPPQGQGQDIALAPAAADHTVLVSGLLDPPPSVDLSSNTDWTISAQADFPIASVRDLLVVVTYTVAMK